MAKSSSFIQPSLIIQYACRDLARNYKKISSIIITLLISLFILSSILTIKDSLQKVFDHRQIKIKIEEIR